MKTFFTFAILALAMIDTSLARTRVLREEPEEAVAEVAPAEDSAGPTTDVAPKESDTMMMTEDHAMPTGKHATEGEDRLRQTITKALGVLRKHVDDNLQMDVDKIQSALKAGSLDATLEKVREDVKDQTGNLRGIIDSFRDRATGDYQQIIQRVTSQAGPVLEKFQSRADQTHQHFRDRAKATIDAVSDAIKEFSF